MKKKILIIGANSPLAVATANLLIRKKHNIYLISKNNLSTDNKKNLRGGFLHYKIDLKDKKEINAFFAKFEKSKTVFDSLIFFQRNRENRESISNEFKISVNATNDIINLFSRNITNNNQKSIVIISSVASEKIANEQGVAYHLSKASLDQLIRYYAFNLGHKNIRVNGIQPSIVYKERAKNYYNKNKKEVDLYNKIVPLGRMGEPIDIARLAYFLLGNESSYITGQVVKVDGGLSLHESASLGIMASKINNK